MNQNSSNQSGNDSHRGFDSTSRENQYESSMNKGHREQGYAKLPADNSAMTLAIIATVLLVICCCCGGTIFSLILSIIGFILAYTSIQKYNAEPYAYAPDSLRRVKTAKVYNLVLAVVSLILIILGSFDFYESEYKIGNTDFENIFEEIMQKQWEEKFQDSVQVDTDSEAEIDEWEYQEEVESDTIQTDTLTN